MPFSREGQMEKPKDEETAFHILALDGGGARGIYPAQVLANIERELQTSVRECFDLIVGTSTGSIIGGAVAVGISMDEIVRLFKGGVSSDLQQEAHRAHSSSEASIQGCRSSVS